jgi:hypothetical protein
MLYRTWSVERRGREALQVVVSGKLWLLEFEAVGGGGETK